MGQTLKRRYATPGKEGWRYPALKRRATIGNRYAVKTKSRNNFCPTSVIYLWFFPMFNFFVLHLLMTIA
jgi:hypothetical protein